MFGIWFLHGGVAQRGADRIHPGRLLLHVALAVLGLGLWIIYLGTDSEAFAWIALGLLAAVAAVGFSMFAISRRQTHHTGRRRPAEQHFPRILVLGHGGLATITIVLVILAATR
jgi:uncharacterized membrane protein